MASKKKTQRDNAVQLECQNTRDEQKCAERNYVTSKNKRNTPDRLELPKYCSSCGRHTPHKEIK